ncbi:MAG: ABC transporter permease subunit [Clostridiales bacterium]|nr:ABC transporter permease subunit [Clostridiales bacterium]
MEQNKRKEILSFCLGIILIGCLIQAAGRIRDDRLVFPEVSEILRAFLRLIGKGETWQKIGVTLVHLLKALAVSSVIGILVGVAEGLSDFVRTLFRPLMMMLRSIPMIVLVVVIMVLTRYERVPLIATSLILIPMISEAANEGCRRIDRELIDVYRMNSGFGFRILFSVYLPLMAGYLKQVYINAVGMGLKLAVSTEYLVQTRNSLGKAVYSSSYFNEYQDIYAYALIMILLVLGVSELPLAVGRAWSAFRKKAG